MFENWGFLLLEIWDLLLIAALVGLLAGWLIWGRGTSADLAVAPQAKAVTTTPSAANPPSNSPRASIIFAKPARLPSARGGRPDDLTRIKGIGPALEKLCHDLGFYHFDQIAEWSAAEIAWVDDNLEGFKGRVSRDDWVGQARALMAENKR